MVSWNHTAETLGDLVEHLSALTSEDQRKVWASVGDWAARTATDDDRAYLRERIRRCTLTRRGRNATGERNLARQAYDRLEPQDPVCRHAWLFANGWVEESWDEISDEHLDWQAREARIDRLRGDAMATIWQAQGLRGAMALCDKGNAAETVGRYAGLEAVGASARIEVLHRSLNERDTDPEKVDAFMTGFVAAAANPAESNLLKRLAENISESQAERVLRCAPFHEATWRLLDDLPSAVGDGYWRHVLPRGWTFTEAECVEIIDRLLDAQRPRAAFSAMHLQWDSIDTSRLKRLLIDVAMVHTEPATDFPVTPFDLSNALKTLGGRPSVTVGEMAELEFAFITALDRGEHGIPNLERMVGESPRLFVQALAICYRRRDDGEDPPEWAVPEERHEAMAQAAHRLLRTIGRLPGQDDDGAVSTKPLVRWLKETRAICADVGRSVVGDIQIGELLAKAPVGDDGAWPGDAVCEAMETVASEDIAHGFIIGKRNARGVIVGDRAPQDRELAAKFRRLAERTQVRFPFVGGVLERLSEAYERDAQRSDNETKLQMRLNR